MVSIFFQNKSLPLRDKTRSYAGCYPIKHHGTPLWCRAAVVNVCACVCIHPTLGTCVWPICMCVTQTRRSTFTSLIVSQSDVFGLTWNKSCWRTCVLKSFNEKMRGERRQQMKLWIINHGEDGRPLWWKRRNETMSAKYVQNITPRRIWSLIKAVFITMGACRPEIRSASAETGRWERNPMADNKRRLCLAWGR